MSSEQYHVDEYGHRTQIGRTGNGYMRVDTGNGFEETPAWMQMAADIARDPAKHFYEYGDPAEDEATALRWLKLFLGDVDLDEFSRNVVALKARHPKKQE